MGKPLIVIAGPTACGKTDISIGVAKKINGEIISADSMQVYKYMDIGTAKPAKQDMDGVKHYLIDQLYPDEDFSVAVFQNMANKSLDEIYKSGKTPILAGGTGFYINALIYNNNFTETANDFAYRNELYAMAKEKGNEAVHDILKPIDSVSAENIHPNNLKRVVRAIEYFKLTGEKISVHNENEKKRVSDFDLLFVVLDMSRDTLYKRIDDRVDNMLDCGLVDEVKRLLSMGYDPSLTSMQGLGYKEIVKYLNHDISLDEAVFILKRDTRHFAKRQVTWFKHQLKNQETLSIQVDEFSHRCIIEDRIIESFNRLI